MKTTSPNQNGIGHLALIFVLVFVAVVGFAGYTVMTNKPADDTNSSVTLSPEVPEKISSREDLVTTSKALDGSSSAVDGGLNDAALDADLNDML
jgi:hypothetical protein